MMRISVYITNIYILGVGNVSNYNLQELNINLLSNCRKLIYYPGFSKTEGNRLVFIEDVYK